MNYSKIQQKTWNLLRNLNKNPLFPIWPDSFNESEIYFRYGMSTSYSEEETKKKKPDTDNRNFKIPKIL